MAPKPQKLKSGSVRESQKRSGLPIPPLQGDYFVKEFIPYILNRVTNTMNQRFKKALKKTNVSISQWRVLATLTTGANLSLTEIAEFTAIDQPTLSRIVDQLVERQLVVRVPRATDGRFSAITLAAGGKALLKQAWPLAWDETVLLLSGLDDGEAKELRRLLLKLLSN